MTLRIETTREDGATVLRLIGRIDSRHMAELKLDLEELMLVDVDVIRFLLACESVGIELRHCLPYIREWMNRERPSHQENVL